MKAPALLRILHHVGLRLDDHQAWLITQSASPEDLEEAWLVAFNLREVIAFIAELVGDDQYDEWIAEQAELEGKKYQKTGRYAAAKATPKEDFPDDD